MRHLLNALKTNYYLRRILPFILIYFSFEILANIAPIYMDGDKMDWGLLPMLEVLKDGLVETTISCLYWLLPYLIYLLCLPRQKHGGAGDRIFTITWFSIFVLANLIEDTATVFFWDEFSSSFNFIAVDYLVYTKEVIGNIMESYPMEWIIPGFILITALIVWACRNILIPKEISAPALPVRTAVAGGAAALLVLSFFCVDIADAEDGTNHYNNELAKDGFFSLFSAFLKNELNYEQLYLTDDTKADAAFLREQHAGPGIVFSDPDGTGITRTVTPEAAPLNCNVIIVVMESMGSEFLNERREDGANVTPNLSSLAAQGIFFPNTFATGTRSVRGLEAVSTSIPPLPGMAILRRDKNENLQTAGSIFKSHGYDTKWIYGGYGIFDNMNYYFGHNGFEVIDRLDIPDDQITHTSIWGVCDEDLFRQAIREADKSHAKGKPFMNFVFTTSNHRPYTYPSGKIDIPSGTGRLGGVKYADYAVGALIEEAKKRPWFDNTVFLFVADHGAGSAGKKELNPETHCIPAIIYAPKYFKPERHDEAISQIDVLPTLLGAINMPHIASYYGQDARKPGYKSRYFLCNYQHIGYVEDDVMVILQPNRKVTYYKDNKKVEETPDLIPYRDRAVHYYHHASGWRDNLSQNALDRATAHPATPRQPESQPVLTPDTP